MVDPATVAASAAAEIADKLAASAAATAAAISADDALTVACGLPLASNTRALLARSATAGSAARLSGYTGSLKVEGVGITATTPVRIVTGAQGKTIANNNRVTATGSVDFSSDPISGLCEAVGNSITAPTQRICR